MWPADAADDGSLDAALGFRRRDRGECQQANRCENCFHGRSPRPGWSDGSSRWDDGKFRPTPICSVEVRWWCLALATTRRLSPLSLVYLTRLPWKKTLVGGVLPDVGGVTLFRGVDLRVRRARVLRPVGGRHRRHVIVAGHLGSLSGMCRWTVAPGQRTVGIIGSVGDAAAMRRAAPPAAFPEIH
jgi:hypothetical protein